jgi:hypothetical protein
VTLSSPLPIDSKPASAAAPSKSDAARLKHTWRWFLGQPEPGAAFPRRLPLTLPATKDIREHPLYGGALSRLFWRINNYRLTRPGRWFAGLTLVLFVFGAMSLDIQIYIPFLYAVGAWLLCLLVMPLSKPRVRLDVQYGSRAAAGTVLPVTLEITQVQSRFPGLDLTVVAHKLPLDVDAEQPNGLRIGSIASGENGAGAGRAGMPEARGVPPAGMACGVGFSVRYPEHLPGLWGEQDGCRLPAVRAADTAGHPRRATLSAGRGGAGDQCRGVV